jgi:uncharacterized membrane protein YozB (DUF420 family)
MSEVLEAGAGAVPAAEAEDPQSAFSKSILVSAVRCTLTYVIFPLVAPLLGWASNVGPAVGVVIGTVAIVANVFSIRRFWASDHKWKWHMSALNVGVIVLLCFLLYFDGRELLT